MRPSSERSATHAAVVFAGSVGTAPVGEQRAVLDLERSVALCRPKVAVFCGETTGEPHELGASRIEPGQNLRC